MRPGPNLIMHSTRNRAALFQLIVPYVTVILLSLVFVTLSMKLWKADFHVPFSYRGDSLIYGMTVKGTIEHGWYLNNPSVGAPGGLRMHDYPLADAFNFLLIKILGLIRADYAWVLNVFFLLTFPLTAVASLFAFRQFNLSLWSAIVWALLYTFMPYHFFRGESHLFIATYYPVPLVAMVVLWLSSGAFFADAGSAGRARSLFRWGGQKFIVSIFVCLLVSSVGLGYYAFFSCFFLVLGAGIAAISGRTLKPFLPAAILIAIISAGLLANLAPSLLYLRRHGDVKVAQRSPEESEVYGLKIAPMLLPVRDHRVPAFAALTERYRVATLSNEGGAATLGLIGSAGFIFLLLWLFFWKSEKTSMLPAPTTALLNRLSILSVAAVLLGTVGGFSSLFAFIVSPQIRTYNRISIFIAFFALLAVALIVEEAFQRIRRWPRGLVYPALGLMLAIGMLDQTSTYFVPQYARNTAEFRSDQQFVSNLEQRLAPGTMVFQLPYVPFPETPSVNFMVDYDLFKGYLHSKHLRWSYGAMKYREGDAWMKEISQKSASELLEAIVFAGFKGIYIDRFGYIDHGAKIESRLNEILKTEPFISQNERLVFFDLTEFSKKLESAHSSEDWSRKRDQIMNPLTFTWASGFSDLEGTPEDNWRWSASRGELTITNKSQHSRRIEIHMRLSSGYDRPANLKIQGDGFADSLVINKQGTPYSRIVTIPPGKVTFEFSCDAQPVVAPNDKRVLIFRVVNFEAKEL